MPTSPPDSDMASIVLARLLAEFVLRYPAIALEVDLSARFVDLIGENFDEPGAPEVRSLVRFVVEEVPPFQVAVEQVSRHGESGAVDVRLTATTRLTQPPVMLRVQHRREVASGNHKEARTLRG